MNKRLANLVEFVAEGKASAALRRAIEEAEEQIERIEREKAELRTLAAGAPELPSIDWIADRLESLREVLEKKTSEASLLLREVLGKVVMRYCKPTKGRGHYVAEAGCCAAAGLFVPLAEGGSGSAESSKYLQWRARQQLLQSCRRRHRQVPAPGIARSGKP